MSGGVPEIHKDDDYMALGTHDGSDSASVLSDIGSHFKEFGMNASIGQYVWNVTQDTGGNITASTSYTLTVDGVTWNNGDTYKVYKTDTKDSFISRILTDVSRGWRADRHELKNGWFPEDIDEDYWKRRRKTERVGESDQFLTIGGEEITIGGENLEGGGMT